MTSFSSPASTKGIDLDAANGHLLLVTPLAQEMDVQTAFGPANPIRANVVDLDTGEELEDILIFPRVLGSQLKPKIGGKVLGRLGRGAAKQGQSPPWVLQDFTAADAQKAQAWIDRQSKPAFSAPGSDGEPF
jgi:hypothetical protein